MSQGELRELSEDGQRLIVLREQELRMVGYLEGLRAAREGMDRVIEDAAKHLLKLRKRIKELEQQMGMSAGIIKP